MHRLAAVFLGLSPLIVAETILWISGSESSTWADPSIDVSSQPDLFEPGADDQTMQIDPARSNYFQPARFSRLKPADTRRVFVIGGSTVQGRPYATETAFAKWLQILLESSDDGHHYEVVNCGGVSYASYRVAKILHEVLRYEPDVIVIYTGHNEFLEDRTYASQRERSSVAALIDFLARQSRLVGHLQRLTTTRQQKQGLAPEVSARLDIAGGMADYVRDDEWRAGVVSDFTAAMQGMISACRDANVPVVLCVPASDLINTPPFKVAVDAGLSADQQEVCRTLWETLQSDKEIEIKQSSCEELLAIDPRHAGANYWHGRRKFDTGDLATARESLTNARDEDVCPLRATTPIIQSVIRLAKEHDVPIVDVPNLLDRDKDGIPDPNNFVDHVHPSIAAHQRIAIAIGKALAWNPIDDAKLDSFHEAFSQHLATLGEDYFARGRQRLKGLQQWAAGRAGLPTPD